MDLIADTPFTIRPARPVDDIRCGQITAAAWMASEVPDKLPHAMTLQCLAAGKRTLDWYRSQGFRITGTHRRPFCGRDVGWVRLKRVARPA